MWLLVGLGNPGPQYERNRHNVGFMVVDELARRAGAESSWRSKFGGAHVTTSLAAQKVVLLKPMKYMNLSGEVVQPAAAFFRVPVERTVVIHDELDLPFGRMQIKQGGGIAGHRGLASIAEQLADTDFLRIRIGIGRPVHGSGADYVLANFSAEETPALSGVIAAAADATETVVGSGVTAAMNQFNRR